MRPNLQCACSAWDPHNQKDKAALERVQWKVARFVPGEGSTLGIPGWECAAGTLEPLAYTRASSAEFCYPILE